MRSILSYKSSRDCSADENIHEHDFTLATIKRVYLEKKMNFIRIKSFPLTE